MVFLFTLHVKRGLVFLLSSWFDSPAYTSANPCSGVLLCSFVHELRKSFISDGLVGKDTSLLPRLMVGPRKQAKLKHSLCHIILTRPLKRPLQSIDIKFDSTGKAVSTLDPMPLTNISSRNFGNCPLLYTSYLSKSMYNLFPKTYWLVQS